MGWVATPLMLLNLRCMMLEEPQFPTEVPLALVLTLREPSAVVGRILSDIDTLFLVTGPTAPLL